MTSPPRGAAAARITAPPGLTLEYVEDVPVAAYRDMYRAVGEEWLWWERLVMPDEQLAAILSDRGVEIRVLRHQGTFAGYSELDFRRRGDVEIAYFGLVPALILRGFGRYLMAETLRSAWRVRPRRVWLHTCTEDHPASLGFYESLGFRRYKTDEMWIEDPRVSGILPRHVAPHIPLAR